MSADFAHTLGAISPEYAEAAGGEVEALEKRPDESQTAFAIRCVQAETRQAAADTVLTAARRLCCGDNPAPEHSARADHSTRMAFAEQLARAVRGS